MAENNEAEIEETLLEEVEGEAPDDDLELVVTLDGAAPAPEEEVESAPTWVKDLRKRQRELERENRDLRAKVSVASGAENAPLILPKKPKLDDDGIDYDSEKYEAELEKWYEKKREVDDHEQKKAIEKEREQKSWQEKLDGYAAAKSKVKVPDFEDAEEVALSGLSSTQQGIIVAGCESPALVIYAIGKNPEKLKELAEIKDPIKFTFAISKLENTMKVTKKTPAAQPERMPAASSGKAVGTTDRNLERLRDEAEKTGDYSKVIQYKKQLKAKK